MVALNVQCSMFNGELPLQLPANRAAAARLGVVVAAWHCRFLSFGVVHTLRLTLTWTIL